MTPDQIDLVQQSFRNVAPIRKEAAAIFYRRLFSIDPTLRALFSASDMAEQGQKLMASLGLVVQGLKDPAAIMPAVEALARRHVGYGVRDEQYPIVGRALIETLEEGLGEAFTPQAREAWLAAYALLSGVMIGAANRVPSAE